MIATIDWTSIILAVITCLGGCGWVIDRKKHTVQYLTLELSYDISGMSSTKPWMFCGVGNEMEHFNFGWFEGAVTEQNFVERVKKHVAKMSE